MTRTLRLIPVALVAAHVSIACRSQTPPAAPPAPPAPVAPTPIRLEVPGRSNAAVSVAAMGKSVAAVWTASTDAGADIYASVSTDGGVTFGAPVRVNDVAGDARASGEQAARVVVGVGNGIHVVWPSRQEGRSLIRYASSRDLGRTFTPASTIAGPPLTGARGWHALTLGYDGAVQVAWLDGRHAPPMRHNHGPGARAMKDIRAPGGPRQDIFHAALDKDGRWSERPVDTSVCFCCKTAVAAAGEHVYVAYRDIYPGSLRDISVARSDDNGQTFSKSIRVSEDGWTIEACPDDGPSMVADGHSGIHIVWPTLVAGETPRKGIFYSTLNGESFSPRLRLDGEDADPAHPQIASDFHTNTAVVWDEYTGSARRIVFRPVTDGKAGPAQIFSGDVSYPVVASSEEAWVVLWTSRDHTGRSVIEGRRVPAAGPTESRGGSP